MQGVYFLYNSSDILLYVGKSKCIEDRVRSHVRPTAPDYTEWKSTIDLSKIKYVEINNSIDREIYETYYINTYKPLYNLDKIYKDSTTLQLPVLEQKHMANCCLAYTKENLKIPNNFKDICVAYEAGTITKNQLGKYFPHYLKVIEDFGIKEIKARRYCKKNLGLGSYVAETTEQGNAVEVKKAIVKRFGKKCITTVDEVKEVLKEIYAVYDIRVAPKLSSLEEFYTVKRRRIKNSYSLILKH